MNCAALDLQSILQNPLLRETIQQSILWSVHKTVRQPLKMYHLYTKMHSALTLNSGKKKERD